MSEDHLQEGMLDKLRSKIAGTEIERRIVLHQCKEATLDLTESVDFALPFYVVHELPEKDRFFRELARIVRPAGQVLFVEPPLHVPASAFRASLQTAEAEGFKPAPGPKVILSKTSILRRG